MKATLVDVHTVIREVELPLECPNCKIKLTDALETIDAWEYQVQRRGGALDSASAHFELAEESDVRGGDGFISYTDYFCQACGESLAEGEESESDVGDLPAGAEHARYTLELWWEALREDPSLRCSYEAWVSRAMKLDGVIPEGR